MFSNMIHLNSFTKKKETHLLGGEMEKGIIREFEMDMHTLLYLKGIINKEIMYSTWNFAPCYVEAWMGESLEENGYMYKWLNPFSVHLKLSPHC